MPMTFAENESSREICLEGSMNITCAAELKAKLVETMSAGLPVTIRLESVTDLDVSILQLLLATMREGKQLGLDCKLAGPLTEGLVVSIADAGFEALPVTAGVGVFSEV